MRRFSIPISERRKSNFNSLPKPIRHNRLSIKRQKTYIPLTRMEKLKVKKIPQSTPQMLFLVSNYEGNGFRNHCEDICRFQTTEETRDLLRESVARLNKECYRVWAQKKIPMEKRLETAGRVGIEMIMGLVLVLYALLLVTDEKFFGHSKESMLLEFSIICVICGGCLGIAVTSVLKNHRENSLETDTKNAIRKTLKEFNVEYLPRGLVWRAHVDFLWVSLKPADPRQPSSMQSSRKDTEGNLF